MIGLRMDQVYVLVPDTFPALASRAFALVKMQPLDDSDRPVLAALWDTLADDWAAINYPHMAAIARGKATTWRGEHE
jgi:hypothetical protein